MRHLAFLLLAVRALPLFAQEKAPPVDYTASIEGRVSHPLSKIRIAPSVRAMRITPNPWTSRPVFASPEGSFRITNLPPGEYVVCASMPRRELVDTCFWGASGSRIRLEPGQLAKAQVQLEYGRRVKVRLRDPQRLLAAGRELKPAEQPVFALAFSGPVGGRTVLLPSTRPEVDGQSYELLIPAAGAARLRPITRALRVADEQGREMADSALQRVFDTPVASRVPVSIEYRLTGKAAVPAPAGVR